MTDSNYDEDITKNKLFQKIQIEHPILLQTAALENWIICLPPTETIDTTALANDKDYILAHVLIPDDELPHSHFISLIGNSFQLKEKQLTKTNATESSVGWNILFTELFYTKDYSKVNIWCTSSSLLDKNGKVWKNEIQINSLEDARKFLQNQFGLKIFTHFNILRKFLDNVSEELLDVTILGNEIWKYVEEITLRMSVFSTVNSIETTKSQLIKKSILMIVLYETYSKCFNAISTINQRKEEEFNKSLLNLSNISKEELGISENYWPILSTIIKQISLINIYKTPVEKLGCLKDTFDRIKIYAAVKNSTVDDLLLVIVYTILKSGYPYWLSTLSYIKEFLKLFDKNEKGYNEFVLTTMEAALTFILNYKFSSNVQQKCSEKSQTDVIYKTVDDFLKYFFYLIEVDDYKGILRLLNIPMREGDDVFNIAVEKQTHFSNILIEEQAIALCHPLCNCDTCQKKIVKLKPEVNVCNAKGQTGLHLAAKQGNAKIISILLSLGLDPNISDQDSFCPIHYAAIAGHQNVLLLLLHGKANIKAVTSSGQSALHLSVQYGHSGCVKALLFYADHMKTDINIDGTDLSGNTALHLAAKWGFIEIIESLMEYSANVRIKNQNGATAYNLSHNIITKKLLMGRNN